MKIGLPTIGSFQTIDGIKFTVEAYDPGTVLWNGGARGGEIVQTDAPLTEERPFLVTGGFAVRSFPSLDKAAQHTIKTQRDAYEAAKKLVAGFEEGC
jgi:hypothetical protein